MRLMWNVLEGENKVNPDLGSTARPSSAALQYDARGRLPHAARRVPRLTFNPKIAASTYVSWGGAISLPG